MKIKPIMSVDREPSAPVNQWSRSRLTADADRQPAKFAAWLGSHGTA
jgi:hypothetical protein